MSWFDCIFKVLLSSFKYKDCGSSVNKRPMSRCEQEYKLKTDYIGLSTEAVIAPSKLPNSKSQQSYLSTSDALIVVAIAEG